MKRVLVVAAFLGTFGLGPVFAQEMEEDQPKEDTKKEAPEKTAEEEAKPERPARPARGDRRAYSEMGRFLRSKDTDGDNKLTAAELGDADVFKQLDKDEDGFLTLQEMIADPDAVNAIAEKQAKAVLEEEFKILDRDDDGKLTKDELGNDFAGLLDTADKNDDSLIDLNEWTEGRKPAGEEVRDGRRGGGILQRLDKDGDGKISKEEAPDRLKENFDRLDKDGDGFLTEEEIQAVRGNRGNRRNRMPPKGEEKPSEDDTKEMEDEF